MFAMINQLVSFQYPNWDGSFSQRNCLVESVYWGESETSSEKQWIAKGVHPQTKEEMSYCMKDMREVLIEMPTFLLKEIDGIKPALRGKQVKLAQVPQGDSPSVTVELLENAGKYKKGQLIGTFWNSLVRL